MPRGSTGSQHNPIFALRNLLQNLTLKKTRVTPWGDYWYAIFSWTCGCFDVSRQTNMVKRAKAWTGWTKWSKRKYPFDNNMQNIDIHSHARGDYWYVGVSLDSNQLRTLHIFLRPRVTPGGSTGSQYFPDLYPFWTLKFLQNKKKDVSHARGHYY